MSRVTGCCEAHGLYVWEDEDMNTEPIAFSKTPCHMNESDECHLAGERHVIHDPEHMEVCVDCYLKFHGVWEVDA